MRQQLTAQFLKDPTQPELLNQALKCAKATPISSRDKALAVLAKLIFEQKTIDPNKLLSNFFDELITNEPSTLYQLISKITDEAIKAKKLEELAKSLVEKPTSRDSSIDSTFQALSKVLAKSNPELAFKCAKLIDENTKTTDEGSFRDNVLAILAQNITKQENATLDELLSNLFNDLIKKEPLGAYLAASKISDNATKTQKLEEATKKLEELAKSLVAGPISRDSSTDSTLQALSKVLAKSNPELAFKCAKLIDENTKTTDGGSFRDNVLSILAQTLISSSPPEQIAQIAMDATKEIKDPSYKDERLNYLAEKLAKNNSKLAKEAANLIQETAQTSDGKSLRKNALSFLSKQT
jgi:inhibitor of KinA sporulation pathway (predicted exonuclease)